MSTKENMGRQDASASSKEIIPDDGARFYRKIYDQYDNSKPIDLSQIPRPTKRRQQRIRAYRRMIGWGHEAILEVGCSVGDLTYAMGEQAKIVVGSDISLRDLRVANQREGLSNRGRNLYRGITFTQMNSVEIAFRARSFDCVVSTSMIEHLLPEHIQPHLREVLRVLKEGGTYLVWCPNSLGHHEDRDVHLSMFSHRELMAEMCRAGFSDFRSLLFNRVPIYVDAKWKVFLEEFLVRWKIPILWSHLGVRNILMLAQK